jgi:hypothetical protein
MGMPVVEVYVGSEPSGAPTKVGPDRQRERRLSRTLSFRGPAGVRWGSSPPGRQSGNVFAGYYKEPAHTALRAELQRSVDAVNGRVSRAEQIKRFAVLPRDRSPNTGELTPTLDVRRKVVLDTYATQVDARHASDKRPLCLAKICRTFRAAPWATHALCRSRLAPLGLSGVHRTPALAPGYLCSAVRAAARARCVFRGGSLVSAPLAGPGRHALHSAPRRRCASGDIGRPRESRQPALDRANALMITSITMN